MSCFAQYIKNSCNSIRKRSPFQKKKDPNCKQFSQGYEQLKLEKKKKKDKLKYKEKNKIKLYQEIFFNLFEQERLFNVYETLIS